MTRSPDPDVPSAGSARVGERRWPMALAVLTVGALHATLPADLKLVPGWVFQFMLVAVLAVLMIGDPGRIDRQRAWLRNLTDVMVAVITVTSAGEPCAPGRARRSPRPGNRSAHRSRPTR